jgi:hypothetical protein
MIWLLTTLALAQAGWTQTADEHGCRFFKGAQEAGGVVPIRAECDWAIPVATLDGLLSVTDGHHRYFPNIKQSEGVGTRAGGDLVWQLQEVPGASDREVVIIMRREQSDGLIRHSWARVPGEEGLKGVGVHVAVNRGLWELSDNGSGGTKLVYEVRYMPGGKVPGFLVRWFQGDGVREFVGSLKGYAAPQ